MVLSMVLASPLSMVVASMGMAWLVMALSIALLWSLFYLLLEWFCSCLRLLCWLAFIGLAIRWFVFFLFVYGFG